MNNNNGFSYTYSASEQAELKKIRDKYVSTETYAEQDKMQLLRALDARVGKRALRVSLIVGIIGTLVMGIGMSLVMTDIGALLGAYQKLSLPIGIAVGVVGMIGVVAAYPLYLRLLKNERRRAAPQILKLADELLNE